MKCCGRDRTTRYCADCGKELSGNRPLDSLLRHVRTNIGTKTKEIEKYKRWIKKGEEPKWCKKDLGNTTDSRAKWMIWEEALVAAIKDQDEKEKD